MSDRCPVPPESQPNQKESTHYTPKKHLFNAKKAPPPPPPTAVHRTSPSSASHFIALSHTRRPITCQVSIPEYELSAVRLITKRSIEDGTTKHVQVNAFGRKMRLNLKDNNDFNERIKDMKVYIAETSKNGKLRYSEDPSASHGTIGNDLVIKPIPETVKSEDHPMLNELQADPDDDEMFLNEDEMAEMRRSKVRKLEKLANATDNEQLQQQHPSDALLSGANGNIHVIFKRSIEQHEQHNQQQPDFAELERALVGHNVRNLTVQWPGGQLNSNNSSDGGNDGERRSSRKKRQAPGTVWPEVLLVVDYDSFMLHGATSRDVKRYFISFWNGVDLRYKLLTHPQIRVSLAGMIVAKDRDATPYLERNRLRPPNADAVDAAGALTDMGKYLYREDRLPTYDMAVVITKLDMCRRRYEGGRCNRGTAGFAYVGGACVVNKRLEKVNSVAIIEDSGGYSGIIVAAHEVGHLLGCVHDGSPPPSYLGGPGATRCPWEDGFIMSDLRHTERGFRWSSCSVEQFKHFLNGETATCLYNFPHENQLLPRVLPGTMLSLDEQCKRDRGTNACFKDARVCAQLFCFDSASGYCVSYRPAAEGSACGDGQICRNGKCLAEIENIIPDYSHRTPNTTTDTTAAHERTP
ncbi:PREDICTED: A disintegrin and metalloproteinase with thrombospondin motifs 1-like [Rhagoletis zephyria]|uniref:A disintegrin and metalloproteinase with thrombospondin motifs 1-like n=1 Tax=Rhagoletis zephyria TaxID=28612 RepID=UPI0008115D96|nr:PREDICTED: A disintegrin and metalloproteinase with thrombospondin motifs 1-like [Rhagoletis zephyria]